MLPSGWQQALTLVLTIIPGFVYQIALTSRRGPTPEERVLGVRILRALAMSAVLAIIYLAVLGSTIIDQATHPLATITSHPVRTAASLFVLIFLIPWALAWLKHFAQTVWVYRSKFRARLRTYDPTPTAWDFAFDHADAGFVRALTKDGHWLGGYFGAKSFATSHPEAREIFIEQAYAIDNDGKFNGPVEGPAQLWIDCTEAQLVQFVKPKRTSTADSEAK
jgi:hypothetical protein